MADGHVNDMITIWNYMYPKKKELYGIITH